MRRPKSQSNGLLGSNSSDLSMIWPKAAQSQDFDRDALTATGPGRRSPPLRLLRRRYATLVHSPASPF